MIQQTSPIAIVGAGQMGTGVALVSLMAGYRVFLYDLQETALETAKNTIEKSLLKYLERGRISQVQQELALKSLTTTQDWGHLNKVSFALEAVPEDIHIKKEVFSAICSHVHAHTIVASNTSSIPISVLAEEVKHKGHFLGVHFFNPVPQLPLVEVIPTRHTHTDVVDHVKEFAKSLGKTVVHSRDMPGFIVNRIIFPMINEAAFALHESVATAEDIDLAMRLGTNMPMGPLSLADFIGLDTCLSILKTLEERLKNPKYMPCPLFQKLIKKGNLGRKTGQGFFTYD
jgi:3-hydroxybutyryl-CoA dehydrogenase